MGFSFAETMAGTFELDAEPGVRHPLRFEVEAHAESLRAHLGDGKARLRGVVRAPPLAASADADGMITIRPIGQRVIRYSLSFIGDDGKQYELVGQKDIRWSSPVKTFTELPAEILDDEHRRVATCKIAFDVKNDLWSFVRSFRYAR